MKQSVIAALLLFFQASFLCGIKKNLPFEVRVEGDKVSLKKIKKEVEKRRKHSRGHLNAMGAILVRAEKTKDPYEKQELVAMYFYAQSKLKPTSSPTSLPKMKKWTDRILKLIQLNCSYTQDETPFEAAEVYSGEWEADEDVEKQLRLEEEGGRWVWEAPDEGDKQPLDPIECDDHITSSSEERGETGPEELDCLTFPQSNDFVLPQLESADLMELEELDEFLKIHPFT